MSSESEKGRCSWDGRRQTVPRGPVERRQGKLGRRASIDGRAGRREHRRAEVTTAVDVSRTTDALSEIRPGGAVQTTLRQNT